MHLSSFENCERLGSFCSSEIKTTIVIQPMDQNQPQTERQTAAPIPVKKLVPSSLCQKIQLLRNATTYTWDWLHQLLGNRAILQPQRHRGIATELQPQSYSRRAQQLYLQSHSHEATATGPQLQSYPQSYSHEGAHRYSGALYSGRLQVCFQIVDQAGSDIW